MGFLSPNGTLPSLTRSTRIMPLVRIDLIEGKSAEFRKTLGEIIYRAMRRRDRAVRAVITAAA
jgi:hypothetical protein